VLFFLFAAVHRLRNRRVMGFGQLQGGMVYDIIGSIVGGVARKLPGATAISII